MRSDVWAGALSWYKFQVWSSHNSGLFLRTTSLKRAKKSWYNCLFTNWPRGTNSWWTTPFQWKNKTNILIFDQLIRAFFWLRLRLIQSSPYAWSINWNVSVKFLPSLQQNLTHTRCSSSSFTVTLSLIQWTACARAQFSRCSSTTNAHSKTGHVAVYCQNLTLGALRSRSTLPVLVGLFEHPPYVNKFIITSHPYSWAEKSFI